MLKIMNIFKKKLMDEFEAELLRVPHITLDAYLSAVRTNLEEFHEEIDEIIKNEGVKAARRVLLWRVNLITTIYKDREKGRFSTEEEIYQHALDNGLLVE